MLGVVLPFAGPYLEERGLGPVSIGLIVAAFSLAKVAYAPWIGRLADRGHWRRGGLVVHALGAVVCAALLAAAQGPVALGLAMLGVGIGYGTILPLVEASVLSRAAEQYGRHRLWGSIGFVAVALLGAPLLGEDGVDRFPMLLAAALVAVAAASWAFEGDVRPDHPTTSHAIPAATWWLLTLLTLHQVGHGPYYAFFSIRLGELGYPAGWIGGLWSVGVVAEMVVFRWGSAVGRRFGWSVVLAWAFALTPLRWWILGSSAELPWILLAQLGHGVTFGAAHLAGVQLVQRSVPGGAIRFAQSLYSGLAFGLGIVAGSALAGPLYEVSPKTAFFAAAGLSAALAVIWTALRRRRS